MPWKSLSFAILLMFKSLNWFCKFSIYSSIFALSCFILFMVLILLNWFVCSLVCEDEAIFVMSKVWSFLEISSNKSILSFLKETRNFGGIYCGVNRGFLISNFMVGLMGSILFSILSSLSPMIF